MLVRKTYRNDVELRLEHRLREDKSRVARLGHDLAELLVARDGQRPLSNLTALAASDLLCLRFANAFDERGHVRRVNVARLRARSPEVVRHRSGVALERREVERYLFGVATIPCGMLEVLLQRGEKL